MTASFRAIRIDRDDGAQRVGIVAQSDESLPEGDVTVRIARSTLNYKDALAITGRSPVVRRFPMVPGIDFAGVVESSSNPAFAPGDAVVLNGWGIGQLTKIYRCAYNPTSGKQKIFCSSYSADTGCFVS